MNSSEKERITRLVLRELQGGGFKVGDKVIYKNPSTLIETEPLLVTAITPSNRWLHVNHSIPFIHTRNVTLYDATINE